MTTWIDGLTQWMEVEGLTAKMSFSQLEMWNHGLSLGRCWNAKTSNRRIHETKVRLAVSACLIEGFNGWWQ
jgi:hypothetical protein